MIAAKKRIFNLITQKMGMIEQLRLLKTVDVDEHEFRAEFVVHKKNGIKTRREFRFSSFNEGSDVFTFGLADEVICTMDKSMGFLDASSTDEELVEFFADRMQAVGW